MAPSSTDSLLKRHRLLAPSAAVFVSPLCLGGMNFGDAWKAALGECDKATTFEILDTFYAAGGNFIDTCVGLYQTPFVSV
jgi:aryl-alcohol dehydrogenase-like predicted oxidoreductase